MDAGRSDRPTGGVPLLRKLDAVMIRVPDLDSGLRFYRDALGHELRWRDDERGQAGLGLPDSDAEIVLSTELDYAPNWLVASAEQAAREIVQAGGRQIAGPFEIPVGRVAIVADPFGNTLVLLDLSKGRYLTDAEGRVTGITRDSR
jgi:predicted enzyme related to lactoylglutathione lyase